MANRAIFLDRDGVINQDCGYTYKVEDLAILAGVPEALRRLRDAGFKLLVITNQSGVARGYFKLADVEQFHIHLQNELARHNAQVDAFFICPHHPDGIVKSYAKRCDCRKPGIGLIRAAMTQYDIDLNQSYFVGDKFSDIECAKAAGIKAIQVRSNESTSHPWAEKEVSGLADAAHLILD